jgi:hypothetical protein
MPLSPIAYGLDRKLERILSELAKMTQFLKCPANKHLSDWRALIEALIEWIARNSVFLCLINHPSFRVMIQRANSEFFVPMYNTLSPHIKGLADVYLQLPEHEEKSYCFLIVDETKKSADFCWWLLCSWKDVLDSWI